MDDILIVDDDALMQPSMAYNLERTRRPGKAISAQQTQALIRAYPPEVIFLTTRRAWLPRALAQDLDAGPYPSPSRLQVFLAACWRQLSVCAAFILGALLLVWSAPPWDQWARAVAAFGFPQPDRAWHWLNHFLFRPDRALGALLSGPVQAWLSQAAEIEELATLAVIVLAFASVGALTLLLRATPHRNLEAR